MLDIKFIRENPDLIKESARKKHVDFDVDQLVKVDYKRKELTQLLDIKRAKQNEVSIKMPNVIPS